MPVGNSLKTNKPYFCWWVTLNRITHNHIAHSLVPSLSKKTINTVNAHIDNPRPIHYVIQNSYSTNTKKFYNNPYDALELGKTSRHRRVNHDFLSAVPALLDIWLLVQSMEFELL